MAKDTRRGRYYLSRVHKGGRVTDESLIAALKRPIDAFGREHGWTFINVEESQFEDGTPFVFGSLAKFDPTGLVPVLNREKHSQDEQETTDLIIAASPFVFLPTFSGVAHLHVWNHIESEMFRQQFRRIVERSYEGFFATCELEAITDLRTFVARLREIDVIKEITATVHPSNPAFGRAWAKLEKYVKERNTSELNLTETANSDSGIKSDLIPIAESLARGHPPSDAALEAAPLGDAAVLMAADGYGKAAVTGNAGENEMTVKTGISQVSFLFSKKPLPEALANRARSAFDRVYHERRMDHP